MRAFGAAILGLFLPGTTIRLEIPAETMQLIRTAAALSGCSAKEFIIRAATAHAGEVLSRAGVAPDPPPL